MDKTRQAVEKLYETALRFHMNPYSVSDRLQIFGLFTDIERRYALFPKIAKSSRFYSRSAAKVETVTINPERLVTLRRTITLEHFDDPNATPLVDSDPVLIAITAAANQLIMAIDLAFVAALD